MLHNLVRVCYSSRPVETRPEGFANNGSSPGVVTADAVVYVFQELKTLRATHAFLENLRGSGSTIQLFSNDDVVFTAPHDLFVERFQIFSISCNL